MEGAVAGQQAVDQTGGGVVGHGHVMLGGGIDTQGLEGTLVGVGTGLQIDGREVVIEGGVDIDHAVAVHSQAADIVDILIHGDQGGQVAVGQIDLIDGGLADVLVDPAVAGVALGWQNTDI